MTNISCYVRGCEGDVVGQCPGYRDKCGRFYCIEHSANTLCAECATEKVAHSYAFLARELQQAEVSHLFEDYSRAAQQLYAEKQRIHSKAMRRLVSSGIAGLALVALLTGAGGSSTLVPDTWWLYTVDIEPIEAFLLLGTTALFLGSAAVVILSRSNRKKGRSVPEERWNRYAQNRPNFYHFYCAWETAKRENKLDAATTELKLLLKWQSRRG